MIRLDRTTRTLEAVLAGVAGTQPQCVVSFYDVPQKTRDDFSEYPGATQLTNTNSTTTVTICAAPSVNGTIRNIDYISIHNRDSGAVTVTVKLDDDGTEYILVRLQLAANETLVYEREGGWQVF